MDCLSSFGAYTNLFEYAEVHVNHVERGIRGAGPLHSRWSGLKRRPELLGTGSAGQMAAWRGRCHAQSRAVSFLRSWPA
jgi:hypothetical protein